MKREEHYAVVTNLEDPERRRRVRVACSTLMNSDKELPFWIPVEHPAGSYWSPQKGDTVVLVMTARDGYGALFAPDLRVRAVLDTDKAPVPSDFAAEDTDTYLNTYGFRTPVGSKILFDDTKGDESLLVLWTAQDGKTTSVLFDKTGITIDDLFSQQILVENGKVTVTLGGASLKLENSGPTTNLTVGDGAVSAVIAESMATLWGSLITALDTHIHGSGTGPTTPPLPATAFTLNPALPWNAALRASNHLKIPNNP